MIVQENPVFANATRGTIQVYPGDGGDWRYRVKSKNSQILASGEGYQRRAACFNALDRLFGSQVTDELQRLGGRHGIGAGKQVKPWRLVVEKRDGTVEWIGQIQ